MRKKDKKYKNKKQPQKLKKITISGKKVGCGAQQLRIYNSIKKSQRNCIKKMTV